MRKIEATVISNKRSLLTESISTGRSLKLQALKEILLTNQITVTNLERILTTFHMKLASSKRRRQKNKMKLLD